MKTCPFCAEEIQDAAILCKHCGRDLNTAAAAAPTSPLFPPLPPERGLAKPVGGRGKTLGLIAAIAGFLLCISTSTIGLGIFVLWFGLAFALPGAAVVRWLVGLVLAIVLGGVAAGIGGSSSQSNSSSALSGDGPRPAAAQQTSGSHDLALVSARGSVSDGGSYRIVEGQVKNISDGPLKSVVAVATWYSADGTFIRSDDALIEYNPVLSGQTSPFKTMSSANPEMSKFTIEFKQFSGGTLNVRDDR